MKYAVIYHKTRTGYSAEAPDVPGCIAAAKTLRDTQKLMREAIAFHLEGLREFGERIPPAETVARYVVVPANGRAVQRKRATSRRAS
jgi:predicted RNase H-like HicB family nuclease